MKRCAKSSHFLPSEKRVLKEAKNKSTALSDGALLCLTLGLMIDTMNASASLADTLCTF